MSIDEIMALADEYVSASIEDHGYRSGAASAEYLEDTKRKLLAALESLIAAPAAPVQQAEPVAWGQLGMMNGKTYLRQKYDREPYPPPPDVVRNLNLVPLWTNPPAAEVQQQAVDLHRLKVAARAVTTAVYDRERLFAVTDLRAALDAMGE